MGGTFYISCVVLFSWLGCAHACCVSDTPEIIEGWEGWGRLLATRVCADGYMLNGGMVVVMAIFSLVPYMLSLCCVFGMGLWTEGLG